MNLRPRPAARPPGAALRGLGRFAFALAAGAAALRAAPAERVAIELPPHPAPRIVYGAERLARELTALGDEVRVGGEAGPDSPDARRVVVVVEPADRAFSRAKSLAPGLREGFSLKSAPNGDTVVIGADDSGALYGCLELARRARASRGLPGSLNLWEATAFGSRGPCLAAPWTRPLASDRAFWLGFLDFLADNRFDTLWISDGDPKAGGQATARAAAGSPEADFIRGLAQEADRRGIRIAPESGSPGEAEPADAPFLASLEPFRYGGRQAIRRRVDELRRKPGAKELSFRPLSPGNWPYSADLAPEPLLEYQRDWIWYEAWGRYAWNPEVSEADDRAYWDGRLAQVYGAAAADKILSAYDDAGECAPRIVRRFGIAEGNRQTLSLGMTLDQLVNPSLYGAVAEPGESQAPAGERLREYADREAAGLSHAGETPPAAVRAILDCSQRAEDEIDAAGPLVTDNLDEFGRLQNDIHCIREMSLFYALKAQAALLVLRYGHTRDLLDMENAAILLRESLDRYRALAQLASGAYARADTLPTGERLIPLPGAVGGRAAYHLWTQLLPVYAKELADFDARVAALEAARR